MVRGEDQEVNIFNMSFLDVLCCTVGALIFILFIQTLRTRDMVERRELETTVTKLDEAKAELARTESAEEKLQENFQAMQVNFQTLQENYKNVQNDIAAAKQEKETLENELKTAMSRLEEIRVTAAKEKKELESELAVAKDRLDEVREELKEKDVTILKLVKELEAPRPPQAADLSLPRADPNAPTVGRALESQKTAHGQYLLGNLETRSIVCTAAGLYLGTSRVAIPIEDNPDLEPVFREFLRFYDPRQEGLWQTVWGNGTVAANVSTQLRATRGASIGQGLILHPETFMEDAQQRATVEKIGMVTLDTDGDGFKETRFEDTNGDGRLDLKRVNMDNDDFFEEVYLDYNAQRRLWGRLLVDSEGDNEYDLLLQDTNPTDSDYEVKYVQPNLETGSAVCRYEDGDNDGFWDSKEENIDMSNPYWEKQYLLFKPEAQRWGAVSVDTNGDGKVDVLWRDTDMSNDDWEEKFVDEDGDGKWDVYWKDLDPRDNDWEARLTQPKGEDDIWEQCELDTNGDGTFDTLLKDTDGDGRWDEELPISGSQTEPAKTEEPASS
jgi:uncharacterized membrane-anchored protein YhcB (DUF1043 family)